MSETAQLDITKSVEKCLSELDTIVFNSMPTIETIKKHAKTTGLNEYVVCRFKIFSVSGHIQIFQSNYVNVLHKTGTGLSHHIILNDVLFHVVANIKNIDYTTKKISSHLILNAFQKTSIPILGKPIIRGDYSDFTVYYKW